MGTQWNGREREVLQGAESEFPVLQVTLQGCREGHMKKN